MPSPSFDELYNAGKAELLLRRPDLFVNEGDVSDVILNAAAAMADKAIQESVANLRKTFINTAEGDDLTTLVQDHFNIVRQPATYAIGSVTFTRSAGPLASGSIPSGTVVGTDFDVDGNRVEVTTDGAVSWAASETGSKNVTVTAQVTGISSNVDASTLTNIISNIFDSNITVTNSSALAGGNDEESDDELRERARTFSSTLRRGTLAALEYGALTVDTVRTAKADEDVSTGIVNLYVADETGTGNTEMVAAVSDEIDNWRCAGVNVNVQAGVLVSQDIDIEITDFRLGFNTAERAQDIIDAVEGALTKLKAGDTLFIDYIVSAVRGVDPDNIVEVSVTTPSGNVIPAANEIIRAGTVTVV